MAHYTLRIPTHSVTQDLKTQEYHQSKIQKDKATTSTYCTVLHERTEAYWRRLLPADYFSGAGCISNYGATFVFFGL